MFAFVTCVTVVINRPTDLACQKKFDFVNKKLIVFYILVHPIEDKYKHNEIKTKMSGKREQALRIEPKTEIHFKGKFLNKCYQQITNICLFQDLITEL